MLHAIPSNRLETLAECLGILLSHDSGAHPLQPDIVMVQHQGMQHWLSMELARHPQRRVCMNLEFPLPVRQLWLLIRLILGEERVPQQSGWNREVMSWRIFGLLGSETLQADPAFAEPMAYFLSRPAHKRELRRWQLAGQLADLFEQYILYRPDWIRGWDDGAESHWQAQLWRALVLQSGGHPVELIDEAIRSLPATRNALPQRLFVFGINTLPPQWLEFLTALSVSGVCDIHVLYLNPSDQYWNDIVSEKRLNRLQADWMLNRLAEDVPAVDGSRSDWATRQDDLDAGIDAALDYREVGNPLLASFGQQGQAFVNELTDRVDMESPLFVSPGTTTLLHELQRDILELRDRRDAPVPLSDDGTIQITSAHTALREVQALHDWLLHQFNQQPGLQPGEILVMCPNVEQYAPFIEAVFARAGEELDPNHPPLPCSIADRVMKDSDPTIAAFIELLELPDSRFGVNQVLDWLSVPAIGQRFHFSDADQIKLRDWLQQAAIHWGLDAAHKARWNPDSPLAQFSWQQGLERLLLGFAWGDQEDIVDGQLLLPPVEGQDAPLLGRLVELLQTLRSLATELNQPRDATAWQAFLNRRFREVLFAQSNEWQFAHDEIQASIDNLAENSHLANYRGTLSLAVVRDFLRSQLGNAQRRGNQFLTGQITVCSMVPMRSVPFRIVAILGLNDGEFPRLRQPLGFDLMAKSPLRPGDRSRRGDDQYLFLESILSARDNLYLSYQGQDPNKNEPRQPSLLLVELMNYLQHAFGWQPQTALRRMPLQPFDSRNYQGHWPSFDPGWLKLREQPSRQVQHQVKRDERPEELTARELIDCLDKPAKCYAQQTLNLRLGADSMQSLQDEEPFAADHLARYGFQDRVLALLRDDHSAENIELLFQHESLSGRLPENQQKIAALQDWQQQAEVFQQVLDEHGWQSVVDRTITLPVLITPAGGESYTVTVTAQLPLIDGNRLLFARLAEAKAKDRLRCWVHHLLANCLEPTTTEGIYRKPKKQGDARLLSMPALPAELAMQLLQQLIQQYELCLQQPRLVHATIGLKMVTSKTPLESLDTLWRTDNYKRGLDDDPYNLYFWPEIPSVQAVPEDCLDLYQAMVDSQTEKDL